jgi:hypothetical protein
MADGKIVGTGANAGTTAPTTEVKKQRKQQGPRQARTLNILLSVDEVGKPVIEIASYNAQDTLKSYVAAVDAGKKVNLVTWQDKKGDATA